MHVLPSCSFHLCKALGVEYNCNVLLAPFDLASVITVKQMLHLRIVGGRGLPGKVGRQDVEPDSLLTSS